MELKNDASRSVVRGNARNEKMTRSCSPTEREREEKLPHVHHPAWMQVFPAQRRTSSVEETTATFWERMIYGQCSSMQLQFLLPFHRLRKVGFLSLFPSLRIFPQPSSQPVVPCIFLSRPVEISLASSFFPRVTIGNFISWRCFSPSLSLVISLSLSTHPPCWKDSSVDP